MKTVLVVDDTPETLSFLTDTLDQAGFTVQTTLDAGLQEAANMAVDSSCMSRSRSWPVAWPVPPRRRRARRRGRN